MLLGVHILFFSLSREYHERFCLLFLTEGDYGIHVKFNDEHVPDSPTTVHVVPVSADAKKITIAGLRDRGLEVSKYLVQVHLRWNDNRPKIWKSY
jgi:hypothetical protein